MATLLHIHITLRTAKVVARMAKPLHIRTMASMSRMPPIRATQSMGKVPTRTTTIEAALRSTTGITMVAMDATRTVELDVQVIDLLKQVVRLLVQDRGRLSAL